MLKGKVLFNSVFTTVNTKKSSSIVTLAQDAGNEDGFYVLPDQEVIITGNSVENIKKGDTILIDVDKFKGKVPVVKINGGDYMALTERDIIYVYDESEINQDKVPS